MSTRVIIKRSGLFRIGLYCFWYWLKGEDKLTINNKHVSSVQWGYDKAVKKTDCILCGGARYIPWAGTCKVCDGKGEV